MAEESRMNLAALQQRDPYIAEIIDKALKVTLYKFSQKNSKWDITDIEGSLFVYRRSASPTYGLMILNRKDLNNLVQPLTSQVEFHLNTPFLLYKKLADDLEEAIWGIWFVDRGECLRLTETIQRILREVSDRRDEKKSDSESGSSRGQGPDLKASGPGPGQNILSLLSNAQKTYDQEHGASHDQSDPKPIKHPSGDASGMGHISVEDLFRTVNQHQAKAGMVDMSTDTAKNPVFARSLSVTEVEAQPVEPSPPQDNRHPLLRLISSKTVSEIERQQVEEHTRLKGGMGAGGPGEVSPAAGHSGHSPGGATESGGIDLMQLLTRGSSKPPTKSFSSEGDSGDKEVRDTLDSTAAFKKLIHLQDPQFGTNRSFIPVSLPSNAHSVNEIEQGLGAMSLPAMPNAPKAEELIGEKKKDSPSNVLPALLKPSDLDPSLAKPKSPPSSDVAFNPSISALLTPQAFTERPSQDNLLRLATTSPATASTTTTALASSSSSSTLAPLNKEQLQQAMLHLIKNDSNFLSTLHAAYLESFHAATTNKL